MCVWEGGGLVITEVKVIHFRNLLLSTSQVIGLVLQSCHSIYCICLNSHKATRGKCSVHHQARIYGCSENIKDPFWPHLVSEQLHNRTLKEPECEERMTNQRLSVSVHKTAIKY